MLVFAFLLILLINFARSQVNLGSLNINKNARGDLEFGIGQGANIFGFGGDRSLMITAGPGKFDTQLGGGALIGGERLGLDSNVGIQEGQSLNLGSMLKFGNAPPNPTDPAGSLNQFINNVGYFFQRFMPPPGSVPPSSIPRPTPLTQTGVNSGEISKPTDTPILIPDSSEIRPKITTEGRRSRPPIPEGLESINSNE